MTTKMTFSVWEKKTSHLKIIYAKTEAKALTIAFKKFGKDGFAWNGRYFERKK